MPSRPLMRYDSGPRTAATCSLLTCDVTENPALTCAPTPQGTRILRTKPQRRVFPCHIFVYVTTSSTSRLRLRQIFVTSHRIRFPWHVRQAFDSCKGNGIFNYARPNDNSESFYLRATSDDVAESKYVRRALIVRTAQRSTKKRSD